jgi:hypothetical protein
VAVIGKVKYSEDMLAELSLQQRGTITPIARSKQVLARSGIGARASGNFISLSVFNAEDYRLFLDLYFLMTPIILFNDN